MPGHSLFCISRGDVSITEQPAATTRSWLPVIITRHSEIHRRHEVCHRKRGKRAALQAAVSCSTVGGGKTPHPEASAELCKAVSRLVLPGAQHSHDKNKPGDKNTARAKRCGHGTGIGAIGGEGVLQPLIFSHALKHPPIQVLMSTKTDLLSLSCSELSTHRFCLQRLKTLPDIKFPLSSFQTHRAQRRWKLSL